MSGSKGRQALAEVVSARTRLDATLQLLVDKKDDGHFSSDGEGSQLDMMPSEPSPVTSPSKKSSLNKTNRKRKRKEDVNGSESGQYHHTYVMKLFDRSVDLAQFDDDTPLYPICRAWMINQPHNRNLAPRPRSPTPEPEPQPSTSEEEDRIPDVYHLPSPIKQDPTEYRDCRIPIPVPQPEERLDIHQDPDTVPPPEQLLLGHMDRWKQIRQRWKEASRMNEMRYADSMMLLTEIFDRQCKDG